MTDTVLINTFEVPTDREREFLALWRQANALLRDARAYRSTRLHRALSLNPPTDLVGRAISLEGGAVGVGAWVSA